MPSIVLLRKKLNGDNHLVYALMGDGEIEEGQNWEAFMFAAHKKIDNLIVTIGFNGQQIDGSTQNIMGLGTDIADKLIAFGWKVMHMNGHNMADIVKVMAEAKAASGNGQPVFIMMQTEMGHPIDFMVGSHKWHGIAPNAEQLEDALKQLEETLGDY